MTLLTGVKLAETSLDSDRDSISDASVGVRKLPDLATGVEFGVSPTKTNRVFQCIVVRSPPIYSICYYHYYKTFMILSILSTLLSQFI